MLEEVVKFFLKEMSFVFDSLSLTGPVHEQPVTDLSRYESEAAWMN